MERDKSRSASAAVRRAIEQLEQGSSEFDPTTLDPPIEELTRLTDEASAAVRSANDAVSRARAKSRDVRYFRRPNRRPQLIVSGLIQVVAGRAAVA